MKGESPIQLDPLTLPHRVDADACRVPLVSVLMPVFNCRRYLAVAIESICRQSFRDFEFVIVDDGSTDGSAAVIDRAAREDDRILVVRRPNTGIVGALNDGLAVCRGEFIARMDGDDLALPDRLATQVAYMRRHPDCVALGCRVAFIDSGGGMVKSDNKICDHETIVARLLEGDSGALIHPSVIFRKDALVAIGGYREDYRYVEDYDLYLRLSEQGRLANVNEMLFHYRLHLQSTNYQKRSTQMDLVKKLRAEACARRGVHASPVECLETFHPNTASVHREWAFWAVDGGNRGTAVKHALLSWLREPWSRASRSCLGYVLGCWLPSRPHRNPGVN